MDPTGHEWWEVALGVVAAAALILATLVAAPELAVAGGAVISTALQVTVLAVMAVSLVVIAEAVAAEARSKDRSKDRADAIPAVQSETEEKDPVIFPENPYEFNPAGLELVPRAGTSNGILLTWMLGKKTIFRWDENPNKEDGPHYHIDNDPVYEDAHFYPGSIVPEPYATIYFGG